jgi:hypothetical protein
MINENVIYHLLGLLHAHAVSRWTISAIRPPDSSPHLCYKRSVCNLRVCTLSANPEEYVNQFRNDDDAKQYRIRGPALSIGIENPNNAEKRK